MHKHPNFGWITVLLGFMLAGCSAAPTSPATQAATPTIAAEIFEGYYASEPEVSSFVTCAMGELPGPGKGYWLVPNDEFTQFYENPTGITMGDIAGTYGPYDVFAIYIRFEGILSAESGKGYGHSGLYIGEVQVTKMLEASRHWVGSTNPQQVFRGCAVR